ncbi:MAG: tRNA uridine-5-carboxymethylaminomethyl(34) synthesis enzyme MnmG [Clostridiales bacterium]|nr:tRNA uridine-5-carboxymethylaminomethyl(34) synthesis enzyme MnmG [Clostridiales bacterium]
MIYNAGRCSVAVIGAGHAGIEAAYACALLGIDTVIFTLNLDAVGNLPCNPSIGGTAKGHLVYELDALGGVMPYIADRATLQSRELNSGKGAAVRSKRTQTDRALYRRLMKRKLERTPNLRIVQAEVGDIELAGGKVSAVTTTLGARWETEAAIICTGTYLQGKIIVGENSFESGPDGLLPANALTESLKAAGIPLMRFKTGTPARVHRDTIDFSRLEVQYGDEQFEPFSVLTDPAFFEGFKQLPCHICYTNQRTHDIIRANLHRSPLYSGMIKGTGPRYCPSVEDKIVRFADKDKHQLFIEPTGADTDEMYIQGFSTSLPGDVQIEALHSLEGFENAHMTRGAYAIEYDCADPLSLNHTLEFRGIPGLYGAGQFNGTSGYEEAAVQGLMAGLNAARRIKGQEPVTLTRDSSYIGMLIDDLVTKGTHEPYRVMTSRSEFRLLLRQDNAGERLSRFGREVGLLDDHRWEIYSRRIENVQSEIKRLETTVAKPSPELDELLISRDTAPAPQGAKLADLLRRPQLDYDALAAVDTNRPQLGAHEKLSVQTEIKYAGYVQRQRVEAASLARLDNKRLPDDMDYMSMAGLRLEARQKLAAQRPATLGEASRISGVSPADVASLLLFLKMKYGRE